MQIVRLLIVEPDAEGHHIALYTRLLIKEAVSRGWSVTILTTESSRKHEAFKTISADLGEEPKTIIMPDVRYETTGAFVLFASHLRLWKALSKAASANGRFSDFDLIYCINLDYFEKALSLFGSPFGKKPFAGMLMNPKFHRFALGLGPRSRGDVVYRFLFQRLLNIRRLKRLLVIDEQFKVYCETKRLAGAEKICAIPDVGEISRTGSACEARRELAIPDSAFVILLYGSLSRRKGVEELLRAVERLKGHEVVALVAGNPDQETARLLSSPWCRALEESGQLVVRPDFHDDEAEAMVFAAADLAWLGYVGGAYGSSGVLYQAGSAGLPVLSMAEGLLGWTVRKYGVGIPLDSTDTVRVEEAIRRLKDDKQAYQEYAANGRQLAQCHTGDEFANTICDSLAACISNERADELLRSAPSRSPRSDV
jgi:glycosyltransferase involved in cell wall biosynthesis